MPERYKPGSGTEGMDFIGKWCGRCQRDDGECQIIAAVYYYGADDPKYPAEWTYERGEPVCTAFTAFDPLDVPQMETAAVADLFPGTTVRPTIGEQVRIMVQPHEGAVQ